MNVNKIEEAVLYNEIYEQIRESIIDMINGGSIILDGDVKESINSDVRNFLYGYRFYIEFTTSASDHKRCLNLYCGNDQNTRSKAWVVYVCDYKENEDPLVSADFFPINKIILPKIDHFFSIWINIPRALSKSERKRIFIENVSSKLGITFKLENWVDDSTSIQESLV